ncbi:MAG TPA: 23S rRNA (adenine(2030)-N(6))-methyltransferase RlmJ [Rhizomicrobium sp.]|jgi:23S rRNA (adenine2030-N6)-methyltransferase|nr:23S rRNA (adenine(2030)-N(6))-methyltransferase RlmJ [Rhizomicrobium sp.]
MNYRHAFHAGNFADVVKHIALVHILLHLRKKQTPFAVIDSHAGRGLYDLASEEALRTGEAANGIERLRGLTGPEALNRYLALVEEGGEKAYPGSPLLAAKLLRPQDRLAALEKHPEEAAILKKVLSPFRKARAEEGDGYARLAALLPLPERRGLVLIDPPFEAPDEFETAAEAVGDALRRFATGIFMLWYPIKSPAAARAFCGEVLAAGAGKALNIEIGIEADDSKLARAGLLVLNPPFGLDTAMNEILALIAPRLPGGKATLEWLREEL